MPITDVDGFMFPALPEGWSADDLRSKLKTRMSLGAWDALAHQYALRAKDVFGAARLRQCVQPPGAEEFSFFTVRHNTNANEVVKVRLDWKELFVVFHDDPSIRGSPGVAEH
jgi:hypothetical protein